MKVFIILFMVFATVFCELSEEFIAGFMDALNKFMTDCSPETGATKENFDHIISLQLSTREDYCLLACINKKYGVQGSDGKVNKDNALGVLKFMEADYPDIYGKLYKIFDKCTDLEIKSEDQCDIASEFISCYKKGKAEHGMRSDVIPM